MTHSEDSPAPLTVVRLSVDSFKRMRAANLTPSPTGMVPVRGKNTHGKSSLIESMQAALLGRAGKVEMPITEGENGATVILDLGDLIVKRRWTRDSAGKAKTALTIENAEGEPVKGPQAVLDRLVGEFADPVAFLGQTPAEQVKTVLGVLGLEERLAELEDHAGAWYEKRRDVGRDADRLKKAVETLAQEIEGLPPEPEGPPLEDLVAKLKEIKNSNAAYSGAKSAVETAVARGKVTAERIAETQAKIKALRDELQTLERVRVEQLQSWKEATEAFTGMEERSTEEVEAQIRAHEDGAKGRARRAVYEEAKVERDEAIDTHEHAEAKLEQARAAIRKLLDDTDFPISGMSYDHETKQITIDGIPFSNASQAERLRTAAAIAMAGSPRIRVLFIREGSLLDEDNLALLAGMVEEWGGQLWVEIVDSNREGAGIWVEDGEAFEEEAPA